MTSESPLVRRRPTRARNPRRNSNLVRASVLETALELGFGQNSTVADWIFNNPLSEEAEDLHLQQDNHDTPDFESEPALHIPEAITPSFTSGSNSTDESSSLNSPANNPLAVPVSSIQVHARKPSLTESPQVHFGDFSSDQLQLFSPLALSPHDAYRVECRSNSSGQLPRDSERSCSQDDSLRSQDSPPSADTGYTSEGQYLSKVTPGKGKTKPKKPKADKGSKHKSLESGKNTEKDPGYASDGGYLSASSNKSQGKSPGKVKSRAMAFFRRRSKKSGRGSDDEDEDIVPPVPAIPIFPRPSSPKPLERRAPPSSPTRPGFSPLTLNLTDPPASPPRRRVSKSPPPVQKRAAPLQQSLPEPLGPVSLSVTSTSAPTVVMPAATAAAFPLPPSLPGTPLSTTFPPVPPPPTQPAVASKPLVTSSSRQHLGIPPPAPPPTTPLPQLPPTPPSGMLSPVLARPATPSRNAPPNRSIPVTPIPGPTRPLTPRRTASPLRPVISPRAFPPSVSHARNGEFTSEGDQFNGKEPAGRQRSASALSAGLGVTPAFLQRRIQHALPPSPRHPPPDMPLPPSPCPTPNMLSRTPIVSSSKFHEHFSSVSSVSSLPSPHVPSTPVISPSPSTTALSEASSGLSVRSSHLSSTSGRSGEPVVRNSLNIPEYPRPTTSASTLSEVSYGPSIPSTFGGRPTRNLDSQYSDRSDVSSSIYSQTMHLDSGSITTCDDDDAASKDYVDDDDASVYPSDEKTAGRRTMYLMEHGGLDGNGDEDVTAEDHYWGHEVPPPLPSLPPMAVQPGPGYF